MALTSFVNMPKFTSMNLRCLMLGQYGVKSNEVMSLTQYLTCKYLNKDYFCNFLEQSLLVLHIGYRPPCTAHFSLELNSVSLSS